jgi:hypothetical protein
MASATKRVEDLSVPDAPEKAGEASHVPNSFAALAGQIKEMLGETWLPRFYHERILTLRTRAHQLPEATARPEKVNVQHTLLGVELKIGRRRLSCPDLATARYLATFACAGCTGVAVPYDISRISQLADELESSWQRMSLLVEHLAAGRNKAYRTRLRNTLIKEARNGIVKAGAGALVPQFNQNTKQRQRRSV